MPEDYLLPNHKFSAGMGREAGGGDSLGGSDAYLPCKTLDSIDAEIHGRIGGAGWFTLAQNRGRVEGHGLEEGRQVVRLLWIQKIFR